MFHNIYVNGDLAKMREDIYSVAREYLATDNLSVHPDFLEISCSKDKKSIGVDEVYPIVEMGLHRPFVASEKAVAVIWGIDLLTPAAQNKLLLTLEANVNVVVLATASNPDLILDTVKSRMRVVNYKKESFETYKVTFGEDAMLLYQASHGDLTLALLCKDSLQAFYRMRECVNQGQLSDLLNIMHLSKEKDPENFGTNKVLMECSFSYLAYLFHEKALDSMKGGDMDGTRKWSGLSVFASNQTKELHSVNYSKDNFFFSIISMIEGINMASANKGGK